MRDINWRKLALYLLSVYVVDTDYCESEEEVKDKVAYWVAVNGGRFCDE